MKGARLVEIADMRGHRTPRMVRRHARLPGGHVKSHVKGPIDELSEEMFRQSP